MFVLLTSEHSVKITMKVAMWRNQLWPQHTIKPCILIRSSQLRNGSSPWKSAFGVYEGMILMFQCLGYVIGFQKLRIYCFLSFG